MSFSWVWSDFCFFLDSAGSPSPGDHPGHQLLTLQQGGWSSPFLPELPHLFCQSIYHSLLQASACLSVLHWSVGSLRAGSALSVLASFEPVLWTRGGTQCIYVNSCAVVVSDNDLQVMNKVTEIQCIIEHVKNEE